MTLAQPKTLRILIIEDCAGDALLMAGALRDRLGASPEVTSCSNLQEAMTHLGRISYDAILLDLLLPDSHGVEKIPQIQAVAPSTPIVVITGVDDDDIAARAIRMGAEDYVVKGKWSADLLRRVLRHAIERAQARADLFRSQQWFSTLCATCPDGILVTDGQTITFANPAAQAMMGDPASARLTGSSFARLVAAPEDVSDLFRRFASADSVPFEAQIRRLDNSMFDAEITISRLPHGQQIYAMVVLRDLSPLRRAMTELRQSEERFRILADGATCGIFVSRGDHLVFINAAGESLTGYSREELTERSFWDLIHPDHVQMVREKRAARLSGQAAPERYEFMIRTKSGEGRWVDFTASLAELQGGRVVLGTILDITEKRHLEEQLRYAQKMEAVGRLAGGVAHDFNNLLMIIDGFARLLEEDLRDHRSQSSSVKEIITAAERAREITRQLLAFGRKQTLNPHDLCLATMLDNQRPALERMLGDGVTLRIHAGVLPTVHADEEQLRQVIFSVLAFLRDQGPQGGSIDVSLHAGAARHSGTATSGEWARVAIQNDGAPIDEQTRMRLFEPFGTNGTSVTKSRMRLASAHGIIEQSGGQIEAAVVDGRNCINLFLPARFEPGRAASQDQAQEPSTRLLVLLVDDEPRVRQLAEKMLRSLGHEVLAATDAESALELARIHPVHVLVSDIVMPGMVGTALAERVRQVRPEAAIVFMSGFPAEHLQSYWKDKQSSQRILLQKPFSLDDLQRALASAVPNSQNQPSEVTK